MGVVRRYRGHLGLACHHVTYWRAAPAVTRITKRNIIGRETLTGANMWNTIRNWFRQHVGTWRNFPADGSDDYTTLH
jgi:hypothetical protein